MSNDLFAGFLTRASHVTLPQFCVLLGTALILGLLVAVVYARETAHTRSFAVALALLPAIVTLVILMVSGSIGAGVAVAGTFSLIRFRSAPGSAREIIAVFLTMAIGLACGMGCPGIAAVFTVVMCLVYILYSRLHFGEKKADLQRSLRITVPEDLEFTNMFDDIFKEYTTRARLIKVKTTNLGSLNRLTYSITLRECGKEKEFIDALRVRNGNLEIFLTEEAEEGCLM